LLIQVHSVSFKVTGDNFAATVAEPFPCCHHFKNQRGSHSWGCLEYLPALHDTSEKCWIALVLHLCRLHTPFLQFLLQFYRLQNKTLLSHVRYWLHGTTVLLWKIKQEYDLESICSRWCNWTKHVQNDSSQFRQWPLDSTGSFL
jgi:hypothetical protein